MTHATPGAVGGGHDASGVVVTALDQDDWPQWRSLRQRALADAPDSFSTPLAEWTGPGDTEERWRARLTSVPRNLVASLGGDPVGMVSATAPVDGEVELISLWVAPAARGRGVGAVLVESVARWAAQQGARGVALDVREANAPAVALYRSQGFVDAGPSPASVPEAPERRMVRTLP